MYGHRKSPRRWSERFTSEAKKIELENDINEPCLFTWRFNGKFAMLIVYVDDIILAGNCIEKFNEIKIKLSNKFKMKIIGDPGTFLFLNFEIGTARIH